MLRFVEFGLLAVSLLIVAALIMATPVPPPEETDSDAQPELHT